MSELDSYLSQLKNKKEETEERSQKHLIKIKGSLNNLEKIGGRILSLSKKCTNSAVNGHIIEAEDPLKDAGKLVDEFNRNLSEIRTRLATILKRHRVTTNELQNLYSKIKALEDDFSRGKEEFWEAKITYLYFKDAKKIFHPRKSSDCDFEIYAGALADFCGELLRRARADVFNSAKSTDNIKIYYRDTKNIYNALSSFSFSNSSGVRNKMEHVKGYIAEFERILYELKIYDLRRNNNHTEKA